MAPRERQYGRPHEAAGAQRIETSVSTPNAILEEEMLLTRLVTHYAVAVDERDWRGLEQLFTPGARIDYSQALGPAGPIEEILPWLEANLSRSALPRCQHMLSNVVTTVDRDDAKGRADYLNADVFASPSGELRLVIHGGVYRLAFRREDSWRISALTSELIWRQEPSPETTDLLFREVPRTEDPRPGTRGPTRTVD